MAFDLTQSTCSSDRAQKDKISAWFNISMVRYHLLVLCSRFVNSSSMLPYGDRNVRRYSIRRTLQWSKQDKEAS